MNLIYSLFITILVTTFLSLVPSFSTKTLGIINNLRAMIVLVISCMLFEKFENQSLISNDFFILDSLSVFSLLLVSSITFFVTLYSYSYLLNLKSQKEITRNTSHNFYVFMNLFILMMILCSIFNNIGWIWISIEGTTLLSSLLLGLYSKSKNLEAAWKYLILCTVGIFLALIGIVFFITSVVNASDISFFSIRIFNNSNFIFNQDLLKIAFVLIFIGFGTKVGLFPMHTWLPDAYGNADPPVSALLSSVLSPIVLVPILRFKHITDLGLSSDEFTNNIFFLFGLLTLVFSAIFLVNQSDYKRLLAYSSMENTGLIVLAFGLGSPLAITGAFLHIVFHSLTKTTLFLSAGNLFLVYHSALIEKVKGSMAKIPFTSITLMIGVFAILGLAPLPLFFSKFIILKELINKNLALSLIVLSALAIVFGSFIYYFNRIIFYNNSGSIKTETVVLKSRFTNAFSILLPLVLMFFLGVLIPNQLLDFIRKITYLLIGEI
jgi:hydrogenase-4 component F